MTGRRLAPDNRGCPGTVTRLAVLMTCHNRVDRTIACLRALSEQQSTSVQALDVVLVDAGSTDGTRETVRQHFPRVEVIERGPDLFWNGGMRVALAHAYESDPDLYLWLNDDVALDEDGLATLIDCHRELEATRPAPAIVVGSTRDPDTGAHTYGGVVRRHRARPMRYELVDPATVPRQVETMNGNCVLVPRAVVARIGSLAGAYTHGMGDYDYGHRADRAGCEIWIAPGTIGTCARNPAAPRAASLDEHRRRVTSPTGGLPPSEWFTYVRRWAGPLWPIYAVSPYARRFLRWAVQR
jgi:GT2 family glycosyltransferase